MGLRGRADIQLLHVPTHLAITNFTIQLNLICQSHQYFYKCMHTLSNLLASSLILIIHFNSDNQPRPMTCSTYCQVAPVKHACTICTKSYSRKYLLNKHLKEVHGVEGDKCTRNFNCPFKCGVGPYRTNIELLHHCEEVHQTSLGTVCM